MPKCYGCVRTCLLCRGSRVCRQAKPGPKRRRPNRGGGGRWRAFVFLKTAGCRRRPNLAEIAAAYRAASPEELARCLEAGSLATVRHREPSRNTPAFGPRTRQLQARRRQALKLAVWSRVRALSPDLQPQVVLDRLRDLGEAGMVSGHTSRAFERFARRQAGLAELDGEAALKKWTSTIGKTNLEFLEQRMPGLPTVELTPVPASCGMCFMWRSSTADLGRACGLANFEYQSKVGIEFERDWKARHRSISHGKCAPIQGLDGDAAEESPCYTAGYCVCSDAGRLRRRFHVRLVNAVKQSCPPKTAMREQLTDARLVMELRSGAPDANLGEPVHGRFYHIGYVSLNPYFFAVHRLEPVGDLLEAADNRTRTYLKVGSGITVSE